MSNPDTPTDPQQLRNEIEETRAELGETVQALAAKTDVQARAKRAVGDAAEQAKQKLTSATDRAAQAAGAVAQTAASAKDQLAQGQVPPQMRRPLPWAAFGGAAVLVGLVVFLVRRRRS
jgi:hypothetical protein